MSKKEHIIKLLELLSEENLVKVEDFIKKLVFPLENSSEEDKSKNLNERSFRNIFSLKEYIFDFNNNIFLGKSYGLFWRRDKDENITLKLKDRNAVKGKVGLNIDFNLMKNIRVNTNELEINILIRNKDLMDLLKVNGFVIHKPYFIRQRYISSTMPGEYYGDLLIKNISNLQKVLEICNKHLEVA